MDESTRGNHATSLYFGLGYSFVWIWHYHLLTSLPQYTTLSSTRMFHGLELKAQHTLFTFELIEKQNRDLSSYYIRFNACSVSSRQTPCLQGGMVTLVLGWPSRPIQSCPGFTWARVTPLPGRDNQASRFSFILAPNPIFSLTKVTIQLLNQQTFVDRLFSNY